MSPRLALRAVVLLAAAACAGPAAPSSFSLTVAYAPALSSAPDPAATGCVHHFAPLQLEVVTSWGATSRLQPGSDGTGVAVFTGAGSGPQWVYVIDVSVCQSDAEEPRPLTGVRVNGVPLTRVQLIDGAPVLAFDIDARGVVRP